MEKIEQLEQKIDSIEKKIDDLQKSINTIKRIFYWTFIISIVLFVLPLIGLLFVIPQFLSTYSSISNIGGMLQ